LHTEVEAPELLDFLDRTQNLELLGLLVGLLQVVELIQLAEILVLHGVNRVILRLLAHSAACKNVALLLSKTLSLVSFISEFSFGGRVFLVEHTLQHFQCLHSFQF